MADMSNDVMSDDGLMTTTLDLKSKKSTLHSNMCLCSVFITLLRKKVDDLRGGGCEMFMQAEQGGALDTAPTNAVEVQQQNQGRCSEKLQRHRQAPSLAHPAKGVEYSL